MPIVLVCDQCGAGFRAKPSGDRVPAYCSRRCMGLAQRRPAQLSNAELQAKIEANSIPIPFSGCWVWLGATSRGYGNIYIGGGRTGYNERVHRVAFEIANGPIPEGLQLDHLCRVPGCWNPAHLEAVSAAVNTQRRVITEFYRAELRRFSRMGLHVRRQKNASKTHCLKGHALTQDNTYVAPNGLRRCRECRRATSLKYSRGSPDKTLPRTLTNGRND